MQRAAPAATESHPGAHGSQTTPPPGFGADTVPGMHGRHASPSTSESWASASQLAGCSRRISRLTRLLPSRPPKTSASVESGDSVSMVCMIREYDGANADVDAPRSSLHRIAPPRRPRRSAHTSSSRLPSASVPPKITIASAEGAAAWYARASGAAPPMSTRDHRRVLLLPSSSGDASTSHRSLVGTCSAAPDPAPSPLASPLVDGVASRV